MSSLLSNFINSFTACITDDYQSQQYITIMYIIILLCDADHGVLWMHP